MEHILNLSLDRKGSVYHGVQFLHQMLYLKEHCVPCQELLFCGDISGVCPFQSLSFCCLCCNAQSIPSEVTITFNLNGGLSWEMPRALIFFTRIFAFTKEACCPSLTHTLYLPEGIRERETLCQVRNRSPSKPPNPYKGLYLFHILKG